MKNRFEVSTEGMRELQSGREPWQLAKELVSNAWDEKAKHCRVELRSLTSRTAYLSVYDDGNGFKDIVDAWTLMKHTDKRLDPEMRGRFNIGEKEILAVAQSAKITTAGKIISFPAIGGRQVTKSPKPVKGTLVEAWLPWGSAQVREAMRRLSQLMTPPGVTYTVNGSVIPSQSPHKVVQVVLETVLQRGPGEPVAATRRKTAVEIYRTLNGCGSQLCEMGIPVHAIDCPYSVNVLQKIPLPPNRDTVKASYLQDIYTAVLNATADEVEDASANWIRVALEDKDVDHDAARTIITKRYGKKVALWSSDTMSNDKALAAGYEIVHGRTLSNKERGLFTTVGVQYTSDAFPAPSGAPPATLSEDKLTEGMKHVRQYAKQLHEGLFGKEVSVSFYSQFGSHTAASYGAGCLSFNVSCLGRAWFDTIDANTTGLLIHEFAHTEGIGHEPSYYRSLQNLAGRAVHLALDRPSVFEVKGLKGEQDERQV